MTLDDIDIVAYALRLAIRDQETRRQHRLNEGAKDVADGCAARISRMRLVLWQLDRNGAVDDA